MTEKSCCTSSVDRPKGFLSGLLYGLVPHSFCIAFVIFSVLGATFATTFFKQFLLLPYFFEILVGISLVFATVSAMIYLKKLNCLSCQGIKAKWKYLSVMYGTTIAVNLLLFLVVFPLTANLRAPKLQATEVQNLSSITLQVKIPCSGHASLIIDEIDSLEGVVSVNFKMPNKFVVSFDSSKISLGKITSLPVFMTYPAEVVN